MFGREGAVFLVNSRVGLRKLACWNGHHIIDAFFRSVKRGFFAPLVMSDDGGSIWYTSFPGMLHHWVWKMIFWGKTQAVEDMV